MTPLANLGIGTSSPAYRLDAQTSSTTWAARVLNTNANGAGLLVRTDSTNNSLALGVYGNGAYRMVVRSDGNVGIGTSSPSSDLHIASSLATIRLEDSDIAGGAAYSLITGSSAGNMAFSADPDNVRSGSDFRFNVDGSEVMRIDSIGNLLVLAFRITTKER